MTTLDRLSNLAAKYLPVREVVIDGELYLRRFFLTPRSWPVRAFLHHIRKSDAGRDMHDHPWSFVSVLLFGGYTEQTPTGQRRHHLFVPHLYRAEDTHMVQVEAGKQVISLCLIGPARRVWGFHTDDGWKPWREYLGVPDEVPTPLEDVFQTEANR